MRQTLFHIPHEINGIPVFGFGIALVLWCLLGGLILFLSYRKSKWSGETLGQLPILILVAVAIIGVLPSIEVKLSAADGREINLGLPIRGYGVMVLFGVIAGVALSIWRGRKVGISSDSILGLAFMMFVFGIVGARLFYIVQYWDLIHADSFKETLVNMVSFVTGGLVVYGSLIGALIGFTFFCRKHKLPALAIADLIAPSLAIGLAIGRIGCLMNGCCYGGLCEKSWAVTFPAESPAHVQQKSLGLFHGVRLADSPNGVVVAEINDDIISAKGLSVGEIIQKIDEHEIDSMDDAQFAMINSQEKVEMVVNGGRREFLLINEIPQRSLPVHPTQIYSAINALFIFFLGLSLYPYRTRDGQIIAVVLTIYAGTRFLLEIIRNDEGSFYATGLTISQNVSIAMGIGLVAFWIFVFLRKKEIAFAPR